MTRQQRRRPSFVRLLFVELHQERTLLGGGSRFDTGIERLVPKRPERCSRRNASLLDGHIFDRTFGKYWPPALIQPRNVKGDWGKTVDDLFAGPHKKQAVGKGR
jgi:hypothetical protein